jgi:hypothetical protein
MLYDKLWELVVRTDWHSMTVEYNALAVGVFVAASILIWNGIRVRKRMRRIETKLERIQNEINLLQIQYSRGLMAQLNAKYKGQIDPRNVAMEMGGGDVTQLPTSPPTTPAQPESAGGL